MKNNFILVIAGEPESVFLEVFFKALTLKKYRSPIVLICNKNILNRHMKKNNFKKKLNILNLKKLNRYKLTNNYINLINVTLDAGKENEYLTNSFNLAFKIIKKGFSNRLINGPINKSTFLKKKFLGITEYISQKFKKKKTGMLLYNKELSVCPLTTHLPIKLVSKNITKKILNEKIELVNDFYKKHIGFCPKIGVTGLNPHCESILTINEDQKIISPVINSKKNRVNVSGPYPADTIFLKNNRRKFNVIIGMYHDQVLTPIKALYEFDPINITMGLPFIRITPDHGPNKNMIGKKSSNPSSIINALNFLDKS